MLNRNNDAYLIPTTSAADFGGAGVLLHYHHHPHHNHHHHHPDQVFPSLYLSAPLENTNVYSSQDNGGLNGEASSAVRKPTAKKERHRKIYTSQGPRDRRVRLSIGIARKFFDLQEMLVFDKPSKTLDWLLTKSKAAIKELVQTKQNGAVCSSNITISSPSECDSKRKGKGDAAKEMRAKARARARERTLEKMCKKQLGGCETQNVNGSSSNSVKMNGGYCNEAATRDLIQDSVMIKKKSKNPNPTLGFQQNHAFSRDLNSNFLIPSANQNWDISGFWDQHKFINNNSNI